MPIVSRQYALDSGLKRYFTGRPCKNGHMCERYVNGSNCIQCRSDYVLNNKEEIAAKHHDYYLNNMDKIKERVRIWIRGHKKEDAERCRKWRAENPEKASEVVRNYRLRNLEKFAAKQRNRQAKKKEVGGEHTANDVVDILRMQKGKCAYCRTGVYKKYEVDHIVPLAKRGSNGRRNLQILCQSCNRKKHASDPIEFMQAQGALL